VFEDLTDNLSVTGSTRITFSRLAATEACTASLSAPAGATFDAIEASLAGVNIADPGGLTVSDTLRADPPTSPTSPVSLFFSSDIAESEPLCSSVFDGCPITEDGTVQAAGSVTWSDGMFDTIAFRSDATEVPEPSMILPSVAFIGAFGILKHRCPFTPRDAPFSQPSTSHP
jgi:hypothetical protein